MKSHTILSTALTFMTPALACLNAYGQITHNPLPGLSGLGEVNVIDNGLKVCSTDFGSFIDQDNHYGVGCLPGYIYTFKQDGSQACKFLHCRMSSRTSFP